MKLLSLSICCALHLFAAAQKDFHIEGKISGTDTGTLFLAYQNAAGEYTSDSAGINNGNFEFKGTIATPTEAMCYLRGSENSFTDPNRTSFFLEPAELKLTLAKDQFADRVLEGSATEKENAQLKQQTDPVYKQMKPVTEELEKAFHEYEQAVKDKRPAAEIDSIKYREADIRNQLEPFNRQISAITTQFLLDHPQSYVTLSQMRFYVSRLSLDTAEKVYAGFTDEMKQSAQGRHIRKELQQLRDGSPGSMAKNFSATDIHGKPLRLSDFRGKYVLLDFWASWCVPCRKGNPHLRQLYKKYHPLGIEFIGVSDDDGKPDVWKQAVKKDSLPWKHVLRGLDWEKIRKDLPNENDISEKFGIHELPTKILIDKTGRIIGRYDESEGQLDEKLADIFRK